MYNSWCSEDAAEQVLKDIERDLQSGRINRASAESKLKQIINELPGTSVARRAADLLREL